MVEKILVIVNKGFEHEEIYYCGDVEIESFRIFKNLHFDNKQIIKANVDFIKLDGVDFINKYNEIKRIA